MRALEADLGVTVESACHDLVGEKNGQAVVEVECSTTVGGAVRTLRGLRLEEVKSGPSGDGHIRAYALLSWPRAEKAALLAADMARGKLALTSYEDAQRLAAAHDYQGARLAIDAARTAVGTSDLPLDHPTLKSSKLLIVALDSLEKRLRSDQEALGKVCLVGIRCMKDGLEVPCRGSRIGVVRNAVSSGGRQLAPSGLPAPTLVALLDAGAIANDVRQQAACLVGVQLTSDLIEAGKPFTFVKTGARAVVYDTGAGKIVWSEEITPEKMGHVSYDEAMNKGFDSIEKSLAGRITAALGAKR